MIRMAGGPYDGWTGRYPKPPRVLAFQHCVEGVWRTSNYVRVRPGVYQFAPQ